MKKISGLIAAMLVGAMVVVGAGCSDGEKNEILGMIAPSNTWCSKDVTYRKTDDAAESAALHVSFYYTDTAQSRGSKSDELKVDIPAGLTVLITLKNGNTNNVITNLTSSTYILKTFPKDTDTTDLEEGDTTSKFRGSFEKWAAIYRLSTELQNDKSTSVPSALRNDSNYTGLNWDDIKDNFSWKRLLVNYLSATL